MPFLSLQVPQFRRRFGAGRERRRRAAAAATASRSAAASAAGGADLVGGVAGRRFGRLERHATAAVLTLVTFRYLFFCRACIFSSFFSEINEPSLVFPSISKPLRLSVSWLVVLLITQRLEYELPSFYWFFF